MTTTPIPESFLPLRSTAARLGVPAKWLRAEAMAERVPYLRVGRRLLFDVAVVRAALLGRAAAPEGGAK
jgi:hypothetical protein